VKLIRCPEGPSPLRAFCAVVLSAAACSAPPTGPAHPTWADVAPILRGECVGCHGSTANDTGLGYRLDFFDMTPDVCGDAAQALPSTTLLAAGAAPLIRADVSLPPTGDRPRMPPAPAPGLFDWERRTLQAWTSQPSKGPPPADNHVPFIDVGKLPARVSGHLTFTALIDDPDGEAVVGVIAAGNAVYAMNRSGTFAVDFDTASWPVGAQRLSATLCDGWTHVTYDLGPVQVQR
jgi:hypothetical protein